MKERIRISAFLFLLLPLCLSAADIDLEQEYRLLDEAIGRTDQYVQEREQRIQRFKAALEVTNDPGVQYEMCRRLYDEYHPLH